MIPHFGKCVLWSDEAKFSTSLSFKSTEHQGIYLAGENVRLEFSKKRNFFAIFYSFCLFSLQLFDTVIHFQG